VIIKHWCKINDHRKIEYQKNFSSPYFRHMAPYGENMATKKNRHALCHTPYEFSRHMAPYGAIWHMAVKH
jgi:hypothetical protein